MRWGDHDYLFVRPAHWLVMLLGDKVIEGVVLGLTADRFSRGHRFHHAKPVWISTPEAYVEALRAAKVLVDPDERRRAVAETVERAADNETGGRARLRDALLDEVKNLVEWPVGIACAFEREFLRVPPEALITTMESNQKFFPVFDRDGKLTERFIGVANIESKDPAEVRKGYERVIRPRFADAAFFYDEDLKTPLASHQAALEQVTYQQKLGSVWQKCVRVAELARVVANRAGVDAGRATRAAALSKCDLMTRMVGEFPELQGTMGRYYATAQGEDREVAAALDEYYAPRYAGDAIAASPVGRVLAVADKLDTLVGLFAIGQKPTGNKDPFSLRRNALGLARTLIEGKLDLDLLRADPRGAATSRIRHVDAVAAAEQGQGWRRHACSATQPGRRSRCRDRRGLRLHPRAPARLLRRPGHPRRRVRRRGLAAPRQPARFRRPPARPARVRAVAGSRRAGGRQQAHRQHPAPGATRRATSRHPTSTPAR